MQFSQTSERLWQAFLRVTELDVMLDEPEYHDAPNSEDPAVRVAFWERALTNMRTKTYDEWLKVFDEHPDVWADLFRDGTELLHHPQLVHDNRVSTIDDLELGPVLQPGPLVRMDATPAQLDRSAPRLDEHATAIREEAAAELPAVSTAASGKNGRATNAAPPLAGVTVLEFGTYYAAPYGATLLTDLGARVIKIEQLDGDPIRHILPFPEVGAIKVLQGKESIAVDIATDEGREIVLELVRRADAVLQSFRAGVAERLGYTAADLLAVNPDLVYLNAPGYGVGPPVWAPPGLRPHDRRGVGARVPKRRRCRQRPPARRLRARVGQAVFDAHELGGDGSSQRRSALRSERRDRAGARVAGAAAGCAWASDAHVDALDDGARTLRRAWSSTPTHPTSRRLIASSTG